MAVLILNAGNISQQLLKIIKMTKSKLHTERQEFPFLNDADWFCLNYLKLINNNKMKTLFFTIMLLWASLSFAQNTKKYDFVGKYSEGFALVKVKGKYGFIDKTGKEVIPLKYDNADSFEKGLANVKLNGKWGYIDNTGKQIIPLKYDYARCFIRGLAAVELNGKWGFIDINGREIIPLIYDEAGNFSDGRARVVLDNREFYINKKGKETGDMRF
jgi:hypothetical protein